MKLEFDLLISDRKMPNYNILNIFLMQRLSLLIGAVLADKYTHSQGLCAAPTGNQLIYWRH